MIPAEETFSDTWPYEARYFEGRGFKHHFVDEGSAETGETFVCLHGEPTWGYIYRNFIPRLSQLGRVIVPDHMGFGKSETPQDRTYSAEEHCDNLDALLLDLDVQNVTLVMQDWGGPTGTQFAFRNPERIKRVLYIDSIPTIGVPSTFTPDDLIKMGQTPWTGFYTNDQFVPVMSQLSRTILSVLKLIGFENNAVIDEEWIRAYASPFESPEECKGAIQFPLNLMDPETFAFFPKTLQLEENLEVMRAKPAMLVMGGKDKTMPLAMARALVRDIWPSCPCVVLPNVGHFAQEDAPETLVAMIEQFVATT